MTDIELQALCLEYQTLLRMRDWRIRANFCRAAELPEPGLQGWATWEAESQDAVIRVVVEEDCEGKFISPYNGEQTLVHELLHIKFNSVDKEDSMAYEYAIDSTADALCLLRNQA